MSDAELRAAVRSFFAARDLAFRHDDRPNLYPDRVAWQKAGARKWQQVTMAEERLRRLVSR